jgi:hypothetical protein
MQLGEALAMSGRIVWLEGVRPAEFWQHHPWGNMLVSYQYKNFILQQMGRPG